MLHFSLCCLIFDAADTASLRAAVASLYGINAIEVKVPRVAFCRAMASGMEAHGW